MKKLLLLFILLPLLINAQLQKKIYVGYLTTSSKDIITYQLDFEINSDNTISGESTTDIYGKNKTKSKITGNYNAKNQSINFKETQNTSTKSKNANNEFCFIESQLLEVKKIAGKEILTGKFTGHFPTGELCAKGNIYLASNELLNKENIDLSVVDSLINKKIDYKTITSKNLVSIPWKSNALTFFVWDGSNEDNDIISIYFNETLIKENLSIKNKKEFIEIPLKKKDTNGILKVSAVSSGKEGKNTVNILFVDEKNFYPYISILEKGESINIEIK